MEERMVSLYLSLLLVTAGAYSFMGCQPCNTHDGYGRYTLQIGCDKVTIDGREYTFTRQGTDLMVGGHSVARGVFRKTRPWLYVHEMSGEKVDVTFDEGLKDRYPLYTGSLTSVFGVYEHPWDLAQSACVEFENDLWLVVHRWTEGGVIADLQQRVGTVEEWNLVRGDVLIPNDGSEVTVPRINTTMKCTSFDLAGKTATIQFLQAQ